MSPSFKKCGVNNCAKDLIFFKSFSVFLGENLAGYSVFVCGFFLQLCTDFDFDRFSVDKFFVNFF